MEGRQLSDTISELLNDRTTKDAETARKSIVYLHITPCQNRLSLIASATILAILLSSLQNVAWCVCVCTSVKIRKINSDMESFCQDREQEIKRMTEDRKSVV